MVFSSITFIGIFLPVTLLLYFIGKNRTWRNAVLLVSSLLFYSWGEPVYIVTMVGVTVIDFLFGRAFATIEGKRARKLLLIGCLILNLAPLFLFKYYNFFVDNIHTVTGLALPRLSAAMPIGISFFTFQSMSYAIDVYRRTVKVQRSYAKVLLYVSMFPQLIAGPVVRYADVANEIDNRVETLDGVVAGSRRFAIGLAKKVILANYAGNLATTLLVDRLGTLSVSASWIGLSMYTLQIYFDFSGYSDMAIGMGKMFGFRFKENFNYPYISRSTTEFWRRWHISMGNWFRDYVMYPIAMSKSFAKLGKRIRNTMGPEMSRLIPSSIATLITFSLIGFWHGADWNFILWGVYFGVLLVIEKFLTRWNFKLEKIPVLSNIVLLFFVLMGDVLFYYTDLSQAGTLLRSLYGVGNTFLLNIREQSAVFRILWLIPALLIGATPLPAKLARRICGEGPAATVCSAIWSVVLIAACFILLLGQSFNAFLYFRF